jgi:hypothetical protein
MNDALSVHNRLVPRDTSTSDGQAEFCEPTLDALRDIRRQSLQRGLV